jgi:hypothetical protein
MVDFLVVRVVHVDMRLRGQMKLTGGPHSLRSTSERGVAGAANGGVHGALGRAQVDSMGSGGLN